MATSDSRAIPWVIEQQTVVKHQLLRSYMATWMNILWAQQELLRRPPHLIYVDGFAGGQYLVASKDRVAKGVRGGLHPGPRRPSAHSGA